MPDPVYGPIRIGPVDPADWSEPPRDVLAEHHAELERRRGEALRAEADAIWAARREPGHRVAIAAGRNIEYLFWLPTRQILLVTSGPLDRDYYSSFRAWMGWLGGDLGRIPVHSVNRFRDGGTTSISTAEGALFVPSPFRRFAEPTWNDGPVWRLDSASYVIDEPEDGPAVVTGPALDAAAWRNVPRWGSA